MNKNHLIIGGAAVVGAILLLQGRARAAGAKGSDIEADSDRLIDSSRDRAPAPTAGTKPSAKPSGTGAQGSFFQPFIDATGKVTGGFADVITAGIGGIGGLFGGPPRSGPAGSNQGATSGAGATGTGVQRGTAPR